MVRGAPDNDPPLVEFLGLDRVESGGTERAWGRIEWADLVRHSARRWGTLGAIVLGACIAAASLWMTQWTFSPDGGRAIFAINGWGHYWFVRQTGFSYQDTVSGHAPPLGAAVMTAAALLCVLVVLAALCRRRGVRIVQIGLLLAAGVMPGAIACLGIEARTGFSDVRWGRGWWWLVVGAVLTVAGAVVFVVSPAAPRSVEEPSTERSGSASPDQVAGPCVDKSSRAAESLRSAGPAIRPGRAESRRPTRARCRATRCREVGPVATPHGRPCVRHRTRVSAAHVRRAAGIANRRGRPGNVRSHSDRAHEPTRNHRRRIRGSIPAETCVSVGVAGGQ